LRRLCRRGHDARQRGQQEQRCDDCAPCHFTYSPSTDHRRNRRGTCASARDP
jgi:hypothetical protein